MSMYNKKNYSERPEIIKLLPANLNRILDVGCNKGSLGKALKLQGAREVIGIEINKEMAQEATKYLDRVIVGNVEDIELHLGEGSLDCIIYADVLEHLIDPWKLILRHRKLLKINGYLIASIPNIRYIDVLADLIFRGKWNYEDSGILDKTHLRFFTFKSMNSLLKESGYSIECTHRNFSGRLSQILNMIFFNVFSDFFTRQYIFLARKI